MSTKIQVIDEPAVCKPVETLPLQEIVNKVRSDSQVEPQVYLEESKVPHGGE